MDAMPKGKHVSTAVLIYLGFLLFLVLDNMIDKVNFIDLVYLLVVVSCVFKCFIIAKNNKD